MGDPTKWILQTKIANANGDLEEPINQRAYRLGDATTALTIREDIDQALQDWYDDPATKPLPDEYDPDGTIRELYRDWKRLLKEWSEEKKKWPRSESM